MEGPSTRSFLEVLFPSLKDDLHTVKRELSQDLKAGQKDLAEIGDRVATLECTASGRDEELEKLQQEVICLKEQQVEEQAHTEDHGNRSRHNNIRVRGALTAAEGEDISSYINSLFAQFLGHTAPEVQVDRAHRVGALHSSSPHLSYILICVHEFPVKEQTIRRAMKTQPLQFRGHPLTLYQDLSAITLQKLRDFRPVTSYLQK
ncbi:hypothetical protein NDU88_009189 [Pleurodeles waltl]|uniref:Uncharacterized protein n=1 Tax=Pleurodeles waltl TaxID=8319 RepID=A0AAV7PRD6_PLEWA|nr:hypothetical protein NDU88_009189 [Pleurodeles waltl]